MMDAVHIDGHENRLQPSFKLLRQADVTVLDSGAGEGRKPMTQHDDSRNVEYEEGEAVNRRGEKVFNRVMPDCRRDVDIGIRVVQRVKAP
jgi:hypothetical protein